MSPLSSAAVAPSINKLAHKLDLSRRYFYCNHITAGVFWSLFFRWRGEIMKNALNTQSRTGYPEWILWVLTEMISVAFYHFVKLTHNFSTFPTELRPFWKNQYSDLTPNPKIYTDGVEKRPHTKCVSYATGLGGFCTLWRRIADSAENIRKTRPSIVKSIVGAKQRRLC